MAAQTHTQRPNISRTPRGTIEFVLPQEGIKLMPQYNRCGTITGLTLADGTKLRQGRTEGPWTIVTKYKNDKLTLAIKSVTLDKNGTLTIRSKES